MQRIAKADGSSLDLPDDRVYRVDLRGFISSGASASFIARAKSLGALKSAAGGWVSRGRAVGGAAAVAAAGVVAAAAIAVHLVAGARRAAGATRAVAEAVEGSVEAAVAAAAVTRSP